MCLAEPPKIDVPDPIPVPDPSAREAQEQANLETRLRRRRAGAAADVLTGSLGVPGRSTASSTMGGVQ